MCVLRSATVIIGMKKRLLIGLAVLLGVAATASVAAAIFDGSGGDDGKPGRQGPERARQTGS
jgi:hypothetical protein